MYLFFFRFFSLPDSSKILNIVPCANVSVNPKLIIYISSFPFDNHKFSVSVSLCFINKFFLGSTYKQYYNHICLSPSGLLHSVGQSLGHPHCCPLALSLIMFLMTNIYRVLPMFQALSQGLAHELS